MAEKEEAEDIKVTAAKKGIDIVYYVVVLVGGVLATLAVLGGSVRNLFGLLL